MKIRKKLLACLLAAATVLTVLPPQSFAAEENRPKAAGEDADTGRILYENGFETLPEELKDAAGWGLEELHDGTYALKGTSPGTTGLLAQFTEGLTLPEKYTIVVDMAILKTVSGTGYSAGVTFQHTDSRNFYHFRLDNGTSDTAQLYRWPSTSAPLAKTDTTINDGEAYRLRITVDGSTITGYADGKELVSYSSGAAGGNVGLRVYNAEALFDNLTVYEGVEEPGEDDTAEDFILAGSDPVIWNNEDPACYSEISGSWTDLVSGGQDGSAAREADSGSVNFSGYSINIFN